MDCLKQKQNHLSTVRGHHQIIIIHRRGVNLRSRNCAGQNIQ